jgi:aspartate/glutamate racemase
MSKNKIAFIHTSPAAISPLMQFYGEAAPEFEITNLLDDGLLRLLAAKEIAVAKKRLSDMIKTAVETYKAELAMVTCSSVSREVVEELSSELNFPILKIDYPMAREAVKTGKKIGVAATFAPTLIPTSQLLKEAAAEARTEIEIIQEISPEAYTALLSGDTATHDEKLLAAIERLEKQGVDVIVLAQVSMARVLPPATERANVPVLTSLQTSLDAIRDALSVQAKH